MKLEVLETRLAIGRLDRKTPISEVFQRGEFFCAVRTADELSIVCDENLMTSQGDVKRGWRAFRVSGTLDFSLTGVLASIANPLAEAKISIFALSTFDTDYVLLKQEDLEAACKTLQGKGFVFA